MIDKELLSCLVCPSCRREVTLREPDAGEDVEGWLVCTGCGLGYPIRNDIPIMLIDEARPPKGQSVAHQPHSG